MLKKKNKACEEIVKLIFDKQYNFYSRSRDVVMYGYFDNSHGLIKVESLMLYDVLGLLPDIKLYDLSEIRIETEKKKVILYNLILTHIRNKYEPYYTIMVNGQTEVLKWE